MKRRFGFWLGPLLLLLLLSGCKVTLYTGLSERDANEMLAILARNGIASSKKAVGDTVELQVEEAEFANAVELLNSYGYPRESFDSISSVFPKDGLISSPLAERVRFIYALSQNISETLSQINGVVTARVHLVLPENDPFDDQVLTPASASVFIKYRDDVDIAASVPQIKLLVNNSIEGLSYDKVSVALFPVPALRELASNHEYAQVFGLRLAPESVRWFWGLFAALGLLLLAVGGAAIWLYLKLYRSSGKVADDGASTDLVESN